MKIMAGSAEEYSRGMVTGVIVLDVRQLFKILKVQMENLSAKYDCLEM